MGLGRYVVDAVVLQGRSPIELARSHGVSRSWIYQLVSRHRAGGYEALTPRSRRPRSCAPRVGVLQGAVGAGEVVVHEVKGHGGGEVVHLAPEGIGEPGEAPHARQGAGQSN